MNSPCQYCGGTGRYQPDGTKPPEPCPLGHAEVMTRREWTNEYRREVYENAVFGQSRYLAHPRLPYVKSDKYYSQHKPRTR